jgi:hypothetical protein
MFLPGETSLARAGEESAEAVVVLTPAERQEERRAEESRKNHSPNLDGKARRKPKRKGAATAAATEALRISEPSGTCLGELRGIRADWLAVKDARRGSMSKLGGKLYLAEKACGFNPPDSTAGCGKLHVRWRGRANGRNPVSSTRSRFSHCRKHRRLSLRFC